MPFGRSVLFEAITAGEQLCLTTGKAKSELNGAAREALENCLAGRLHQVGGHGDVGGKTLWCPPEAHRRDYRDG